MMRETPLDFQAHSNESFSEKRNGGSVSITMLQTELIPPLSKFGRPGELNELDFKKAVDHLSLLAEIIENQLKRQHGGLDPGARSIISFIGRMWATINRALEAIGMNGQKFEYHGEQTDSEEALMIALEEWDRFTEKAQNQCTRASIPPPERSSTPSFPLKANSVDKNSNPLAIPESRPRELKIWGPIRMYALLFCRFLLKRIANLSIAIYPTLPLNVE